MEDALQHDDRDDQNADLEQDTGSIHCVSYCDKTLSCSRKGDALMTAMPNSAAGAMDKPKNLPYVRTTRASVEAVFSSSVRLALVDRHQLARLCHSRLKHNCQGARPGVNRRPVPTVGYWHCFGNLFG